MNTKRQSTSTQTYFKEEINWESKFFSWWKHSRPNLETEESVAQHSNMSQILSDKTWNNRYEKLPPVRNSQMQKRSGAQNKNPWNKNRLNTEKKVREKTWSPKLGLNYKMRKGEKIQQRIHKRHGKVKWKFPRELDKIRKIEKLIKKIIAMEDEDLTHQ